MQCLGLICNSYFTVMFMLSTQKVYHEIAVCFVRVTGHACRYQLLDSTTGGLENLRSAWENFSRSEWYAFLKVRYSQSRVQTKKIFAKCDGEVFRRSQTAFSMSCCEFSQCWFSFPNVSSIFRRPRIYVCCSSELKLCSKNVDWHHFEWVHQRSVVQGLRDAFLRSHTDSNVFSQGPMVANVIFPRSMYFRRCDFGHINFQGGTSETLGIPEVQRHFQDSPRAVNVLKTCTNFPTLAIHIEGILKRMLEYYFSSFRAEIHSPLQYVQLWHITKSFLAHNHAFMYVVGIVVYIFTSCMKKFARCGCVQGICKGTPCGSCVESCGRCGMVVGIGLAAGACCLLWSITGQRIVFGVSQLIR